MNKYQNIKELIGLWDSFEKEEQKEDIHSFSEWLSQKLSSEKENAGELYPNIESKPQIHEEQKEYLNYYKNIELHGQIYSLINRLSRFSHHYTKQMFKDLPFSNIIEFGFLAGIEGMGNPRKSELIMINLVEITSGTDIIRRLVKEGLVEEKDDIHDKRSKRLSLTKAGKKSLSEAKEKLYHYSRFLMGTMTEEEKHTLAKSLSYLYHYHNDIYFNHSDKSPDELLDWYDKQ